MLDNLLDIEVAYSLLRGGAQDNEKDPIDINYEKLKTKIEVSSAAIRFLTVFNVMIPFSFIRIMFWLVTVKDCSM